MALLAGGWAGAAERDYIGWPFDTKTFPLCQNYGCKVTERKELGGQNGAFVSLQLLNFDAKVTLVLAADQTIMGLYTLIPGQKLSPQGWAFLQKAIIKSANEEFEPSVLPKCFQKITAPKGDFYKRQIILTNNHYGVQCLRKRVSGVDYWGIWVFFDY